MKIFELVKQFTSEMAHYVKNGMPNCTAQQYQERLEACNVCPHKKESTCGLCGCVITLKAKMATSGCPDNPSRWPVIENAETLRKEARKNAKAAIEKQYAKEKKHLEEYQRKVDAGELRPVEDVLNEKRFNRAKEKINKAIKEQSQKLKKK